MESKLNRQQKAMTSLAKPKYKTSLPEKQNTWSNLLNKKSASSYSATIDINGKPKRHSPMTDTCVKKLSKSVQCDLPVTKLCQNSNSLSVLNPIRTLKYLLKEIIELPNIQNTGLTKSIGEMQLVVERIIAEYSENIAYSKSYNMPVVNDESMIPTRDNDDCKDFKFGNNLKENKCFVALFEKISELENNYGQLTKNYTLSEEKLMCVTSERDKLLESFKELCGSMETFNNCEREYLDTIAELKSKLIASEKVISKQETIITNLNKQLNNVSNKNKVKEYANQNMLSALHNANKAVLNENNELKKNYIFTKLDLDKSKTIDNFQEGEVSRLRSDIKQTKQIVCSGSDNIDYKYTALKSENNLIKDYLKFNEVNEKDIDTQYTEHHQQASFIKQTKTELHQLFETFEIQANLSKKLFHSTIIDDEISLKDMSDEEDNQSNVTNFISIMTNSSY